jgi:hypothetical protein
LPARTYAGPAPALRAFRERFHGCLRRRADALFELADALLTAAAVPSPVYLSLAPVHRRGWCSLYGALAKGRVDEDAPRGLLAEQPSGGGPPEGRPVIFGVDTSAWPRCDAECSPERGWVLLPPV